MTEPLPMTDKAADKATEAADYVLVPREPTEAMIEAAKSAMAEWRKTLDPDERMLRHTIRNGRAFHSADEDEKVVIRWRAMLTAAPLPAQEVSDAMVEAAARAIYDTQPFFMPYGQRDPSGAEYARRPPIRPPPRKGLTHARDDD